MAVSKKYSLDPLFSPSSIAIVGASRDPKKVGHIVVRNLLDGGFRGKIFPVNPAAKTIARLTAYPRYADLPRVPDLAIICLPAALALSALKEIGEKGTAAVVVFSAGFKEIGGDGERLEEQLRQTAEHYGMAVLGPNCLGYINPALKINATFGAAPLGSGNVRFISQSGAIATSIFDWAAFMGVGLGSFVTLGNKAVVSEDDVLDYWYRRHDGARQTERDRQYRRGLSHYQPIGLYLESITDGRVFSRAIGVISRHDPVFVLKPGKSPAAQKAMLSHTGAIAGSDAVIDEMLAEAGVLRCHGIQDFYDLARVFAWQDAPKSSGVAIVSNAGGPAVLSTDIVAESGLTLAQMSRRTHALLSKHLPRTANVMNPIDVIGDALADRYATAIEAVLMERSVASLVVILTPQMMTQIEQTARVIAHLAQKHGKPVFAAFMGGSQVAPGEKILNRYKIPSFHYPERAIWAIGKMWQWQAWRQRQSGVQAVKGAALPVFARRKAGRIIAAIRAGRRSIASPFEAGSFLSAVGISVPASRNCGTMRDAHEFLRRHGTIVLKIASPHLLHKTDKGAVIVNVSDPASLASAWRKLSPLAAELRRRGDATAGIMAQREIKNGIEVIVGVKTDPSFGPVLMFGAGGIFVDLLSDHQLRLVPLDERAIEIMVRSSKIFPLLRGYRGEKPFALKALCRLIQRLASAAQTYPEIFEIESNPVIVTQTQAWAADGRVILQP